MVITELLEQNAKLYGNDVALVEINPEQPETRRHTWREFELVEEWKEELESLGYRFEQVGALSLNLIAVPVLNGATFDGESLHQAINAIGEAGKGAKRALVREKLIYSSCKHAVKGGETLHKEEIVSLLKTYVDQGIPLTCPHGRPVVARLSRRDMEKMFKRVL